MTHQHAEEREEQPEEGQTGEHDTHRHDSHRKTVRVLALELIDLALVGLDEVLDAWSDVLGLLQTPALTIAGITLVGCQDGHRDRVDEFHTIAIVQAYPHHAVGIDRQGEMQLALIGTGVGKEHQVLTTAHIGAFVATGDGCHELDTLGCRQRLVEGAPVGGKIHAAHIIGCVRHVLEFHPRFVLTKLINDAGSIVGHHLVDDNVLGSLAKHHTNGRRQQRNKQKFESFHVIKVRVYYISF